MQEKIIAQLLFCLLTWQIAIALLALAFFAYFFTALGFAGIKHCHDQHDIVPLVALTCAALFLILVSFVSSKFGDAICENGLKPIHTAINNHWNVLQWCVKFSAILFWGNSFFECKLIIVFDLL